MRALLALWALACATPAQEKNVLVILADDLGLADLATVGKAGYTPNINDLAAEGIVFVNAFANPTCSPTRDSLLTSRWGGKLDGTPCDDLSGLEPPLALTTLPDLAVKAGLRTALFGKWHLGPAADGTSPMEDAALLQGFEFWCGIPSNPGVCGGDPLNGYLEWLHVHGGKSEVSEDYLPRVVLDDLKAWWFGTKGSKLAVWAISLPHGPMHRPPEEELPEGYPATTTPREQYEAMIATLDRHVGEMLSTVDLETTLVIFLGDNGTPSNVAPMGFAGKSKGTTFERGIHIPCVLAAPGISSGLSERMVHVADVLPTVAEYLGVEEPASIVGVSMGAPANVRPSIIAIEFFELTRLSAFSDACVRSERFKLRREDWHTGSPDEFFYDLWSDPMEASPLGPSAFPAIRGQMQAALDAALPQ